MVKDTGTLPQHVLLKEAGDFEMTDETRPSWFRCDGRGMGTISRRVPRLRFRLLQPEPHVHLAVHRRRGREVLLCLLALARALVELAEAEVAVGDEGAHAARLGQRQRLAVVGLAALRVEPIGMGRDVAEQVQRMGRGPRVRRRILERAVAQAPRLVELAEQQAGTTQRVVSPAAVERDSLRRVTFEELLALPEPGQRLAHLTDLRENPGEGGYRGGKAEDDVARPVRGDPVLDQ